MSVAVGAFSIGISGPEEKEVKPKDGMCMYFCSTFISKLDQMNWDVEVLFAKELKVLTNYIKNAKGDVDRRASQVFKFKKESLTLYLHENIDESIVTVPDYYHPYKILRSAIDHYGRCNPPQPFISKYMVVKKPSSDGTLLPSFILSVSDVEPPLMMNIGIRTIRADHFATTTATAGDDDSLVPPSEKRCMEPESSDFCKMFLNEHDYLGKELSSIKVAGKFVSKSDALVIETSSFSAQFGSTVPITDLTHGAVIAEERLFVIGGENLLYHEWEEGGLVIHASENCVPPLSICEMRVSALVGGDFLFPDGHELVSAVYAVTFSQSLQQDVVLDLQHCVDLQIEKHTDCLSFAVASPLPSPGTYTFESIKGGRFSVKDRYGSIETSDSLCYCILMKECSLGKEKEDQNSDKRSSHHAGKEHKCYKEDDEAGNDESDPSSAGSEGGATGGGGDDSDGSSDSSQEKQESSDNESEEKTSEDETARVQDLDEEEGGEEKEEVKPKDGRSDVTVLPEKVDKTTQVDSSVSKPNGEPMCTLMYVCQTFTSKLDQIYWNVEIVFAKELDVLTNYIKKSVKGDVDELASGVFKFKGESLTLDFLEENPKSIEISKCVKHPYEILRSAIDRYGRYKPPRPFSSKYMVAIKSSSDRLLLPLFTLSVTDVEPSLEMNICIRTKRADHFATTAATAGDDDSSLPPSEKRCMESDDTAAGVEIRSVITCIKEKINDNFAILKDLFEISGIETVAAELFAAGLISTGARKRKSYDTIIGEFYAGLGLKMEISNVENHCKKFLAVFYKLGGPYKDAGDLLKQSIVKHVHDELNVNLLLD